MRLSKLQTLSIVQAIQPFATEPYELFLIGSRTDDSLKGGDIDLLIICSKHQKINFETDKRKIVNQIMKQGPIDDTKVDLIIGTSESLDEDPFISTLKASRIKLN